MYISNLRIEPSVVLCFTDDYSLDENTEIIKDALPSECKFIIIYVDDFFLDIMPGMDRLSTNIVCILFPKIPNVALYLEVPHIIRKKKKKIYKYVNYILFEPKPSAPHQETSTCLMLFSDNLVAKAINLRCGSAIRESTVSKIDSVWGGVPESVLHSPPHYAVEITGSIKTWSIILKIESDTTMEEVQTKLQSFKDKVKLKKHSIGFISKPYDVNDESTTRERIIADAAVTMLKSLFSHILLLTYCCGWQYGKNTVEELNEEKNDEDNAKACAKRIQPKFWCHEDSVVFMILSYG
ncbi:PREDICTED: uncharacterized protein LOC105558920 [Vollenhovia emeryi]|uniref:uncharacterized protein LOC105558920 n=1 Tax=Vollenhovia emeryi TaxID=411798 RepID=UPI0005F4FFE6|nr:PREDICTED: uncharacterized protein LOC105558920 [Vollenhovia emeryi]